MPNYRSGALRLVLPLLMAVLSPGVGAVASLVPGVAGISGISSALRAQSAPPAAAQPESVAVIPFTNISGRADDEWIGDGIAETVTADLEAHRMFVLIPRGEVQTALAGRAVALDDGALSAVGRALGARWVVAGGYQRVGDQLRITARLVDTGTGMVARTLKADGALDQIFDLQDRIALGLTTDVGTDAPATVAAPACR